MFLTIGTSSRPKHLQHYQHQTKKKKKIITLNDGNKPIPCLHQIGFQKKYEFDKLVKLEL